MKKMHLPKTLWWAVGSLVLMLVGAFGPWATVLGVVSINGTDDGGDGWIVVGAVAIAAIVIGSFVRWPRRWLLTLPILAGIAGAAIAAYDINEIKSQTSSDFFPGDKTAWGIYLALISSISLILASIALWVETPGAAAWHAASRPPGAIDLRRQVDVRIDGAAGAPDPGGIGDEAGSSVAGAGDVNGDGLADLLVGAPYAHTGGRSYSGAAYLVFGKPDPGTVDLAALGQGGFRIDGAADDSFAGSSVAGVGDVNGDGRADLLVDEHGVTCLVFGKADTGTVDLAALGQGGFRIAGAAGEVAGAGDVNGDGLPDLLLGTTNTDSPGSAYLVFGKADTGTVDLAALGQGGFRIEGAAVRWPPGNVAVAGAGDVNGDGRADLLIGASGAGAAYVVFGKADTSTVDLAALGQSGFRIDGPRPREGDNTGDSVAGVGDVNRDKRADVLVAAPSAQAAYLVFGKADTRTVNLAALGQGGFRLGGALVDPVAGASDVNGDGLADLLVGAPYAGTSGRRYSGSAYLVFGKTDTRHINLLALRGMGIPIDGAKEGDEAGYSLAAAGDVNGDGRTDLLIGAPNAGNGSGSAYVVYGNFEPDSKAPRLTLRARSPQRVGAQESVLVNARCNEPCALTASGAITIVGQKTTLALRPASRALHPGTRAPAHNLARPWGGWPGFGQALHYLVAARDRDDAGDPWLRLP